MNKNLKRNIEIITKHAEVSEKAIEKHLVAEVKKLGGVCLKYASASATGYPDRLVMLPGGLACWVELKSKGKKPTRLQTIRHNELERLGQIVAVLDSKEGVNKLLNTFKA